MQIKGITQSALCLETCIMYREQCTNLYYAYRDSVTNLNIERGCGNVKVGNERTMNRREPPLPPEQNPGILRRHSAQSAVILAYQVNISTQQITNHSTTTNAQQSITSNRCLSNAVTLGMELVSNRSRPLGKRWGNKDRKTMEQYSQREREGFINQTRRAEGICGNEKEEVWKTARREFTAESIEGNREKYTKIRAISLTLISTNKSRFGNTKSTLQCQSPRVFVQIQIVDRKSFMTIEYIMYSYCMCDSKYYIIYPHHFPLLDKP